MILGQRGFRVGGMTSKQLANVLIKILGLSTLVSGLYGLAVGLLQLTQIGAFDRNMPFISFLRMPAGAIVQLVIGNYLIIKSRKLTEFLFKDEVE